MSSQAARPALGEAASRSRLYVAAFVHATAASFSARDFRTLPTHVSTMEDVEFDTALIAAALTLAAKDGWATVSVAGAARDARLSLAKARERFPRRATILNRLGRMADRAALADPPSQGTVRDRLFYMLMQRMDVLQTHRAGVLALMRALPANPPLALLLELATRRSMRWLLEAAGVHTRGLRGELRVRGLTAIWLWGLRAWRNDESEDMSATMSALDKALERVERLAFWLGEESVAAEADAKFAPEPATVPPAEASPPSPGLGAA